MVLTVNRLFSNARTKKRLLRGRLNIKLDLKTNHCPVNMIEADYKSGNNIENKENPNKLKAWFKRIGIAGFLFFLIKGLVWLFIFFQAGKCAFQ